MHNLTAVDCSDPQSYFGRTNEDTGNEPDFTCFVKLFLRLLSLGATTMQRERSDMHGCELSLRASVFSAVRHVYYLGTHLWTKNSFRTLIEGSARAAQAIRAKTARLCMKR